MTYEFGFIIWVLGPFGFIEFESSMQQTKCQGHLHFSYSEEDFYSFFTIYAHGGHLIHVTQTT